jgi:hypothetical protein
VRHVHLKKKLKTITVMHLNLELMAIERQVHLNRELITLLVRDKYTRT